ncbi:hypothetical protein KIW84_034834 [Lathyrus oleraceus]|uniref:Nodulin homeobox N-terminal domain-containing protein n=2 Tax=Pisum sativum TaxID=3888 RepID=A0A9D5B4W4_PEA|nr:hypothetical protein KIW84_034834 [Pisum sativum]
MSTATQEDQPSPYHQALHSPQTRHHNHMIICCTYSGYLDKTTHVYLALNSPWQASCNRGPAAAITLSSSYRFMQIMAKIAGIQHQNLGPVQHHIMTAVIQIKADALYLLQKYDAAIQLCDQSLNLAEKNFVLENSVNNSMHNSYSSVKMWRWSFISKCYFRLGKLDASLNVIEKLQQTASANDKCGIDNIEELLSLAATIQELLDHRKAENENFKMGKYTEAVENYTAALSSNIKSRPFAAICFGNRAAAHQASGQIADAITDCSMAMALDGNYAKAISRRATLHEMVRDYEQAACDIRRLISVLGSQSNEKAKHSESPNGSTGGKESRQAQQRLLAVEDQAKMRTPLDFYLILGIKPADTAADIKKAYHKAAHGLLPLCAPLHTDFACPPASATVVPLMNISEVPPKTEQGDITLQNPRLLLKLDLEKLAGFLPGHLASVLISSNRDESLFRYLLCGVRLLHSLFRERKTINSELWHACVEPLVSIPPVGSLAVYFPQGHGEQVAASMQKEAKRSSAILHKVITEAIPDTVGSKLIGLVTSRAEIPELLKLDDVIGLVIPRGSNKLVSDIKSSTKIPVLGHADGICHVYVDKSANLEMAKQIALDAKTVYPAGCDAMETLLVHKDLVEKGWINNIIVDLRT